MNFFNKNLTMYTYSSFYQKRDYLCRDSIWPLPQAHSLTHRNAPAGNARQWGPDLLQHLSNPGHSLA